MTELEGTLDALPLTDLLCHLAQQRRHGRLLCQRQSEVVMLELLHGQLVQVASTQPEHALSQALIDERLAQPEAIEGFYASQQTALRHVSLAEALVQVYRADACAIRDALRRHARLTVLRLLRWTAGEFRFIGRPPQRRGTATLHIALDLPPLCALLQARPPQAIGERRLGSSENLARSFRQRVSRRLAERGRGKRFPPELQQQAVAYYRLRLEQGSFLTAVGRELGLPPPTLRRWVLDAASTEHPGAPCRPRLADGGSGMPVLVGPGGLRVEGLDVGGIADLLQRLDPRTAAAFALSRAAETSHPGAPLDASPAPAPTPLAGVAADEGPRRPCSSAGH